MEPKEKLLDKCISFLTPKDKIINKGMDLRDYFAAKAMQGIISNPDYSIFDGTNDVHIPTIAKCYNIADAMIKQREI